MSFFSLPSLQATGDLPDFTDVYRFNGSCLFHFLSFLSQNSDKSITAQRKHQLLRLNTELFIIYCLFSQVSAVLRKVRDLSSSFFNYIFLNQINIPKCNKNTFLYFFILTKIQLQVWDFFSSSQMI